MGVGRPNPPFGNPNPGFAHPDPDLDVKSRCEFPNPGFGCPNPGYGLPNPGFGHHGRENSCERVRRRGFMGKHLGERSLEGPKASWRKKLSEPFCFTAHTRASDHFVSTRRKQVSQSTIKKHTSA